MGPQNSRKNNNDLRTSGALINNKPDQVEYLSVCLSQES